MTKEKGKARGSNGNQIRNQSNTVIVFARRVQHLSQSIQIQSKPTLTDKIIFKLQQNPSNQSADGET